MRKVESFSVDTEKDSDIINFLQRVSNKSQYIKELIRADIGNESSFSELQLEEIKSIVGEMLKEYVANGSIKELAADEDNMDEDAVNEINQFFNP